MPLVEYLVASRNFIIEKFNYTKGLVTSVLTQCWKQENRDTRKFSCIGVARPSGRIFQAPNGLIRYHGRIQYIYFEADSFIRSFINTEENVMVRFISEPDNREIERVYFNVNETEARDSIIDNKNIKEIYVDAKKGSLIVRLPYNQAEGGGRFVYVIDTSNI